MTQTVPATAVLGPGKTGLTIGLRVLNLDGTEYAAFSTTGVAETSTAGTYRKVGGVVAPLAGGYIVWGTALVDYAEATVESTSANVTHHAGVAVAAADANGNVPVVLYPTQGAVTFGQVKILANVSGEGALHVVNSHANGHGQRNQGGNTGQYNNGNHAGQTNTGNYAGQTNYGGAASVVGAASQEIADALKRAPAAGTPAVGSVYDLLGDVSIDPQAVRDAMLLAPTPPGTAAAGSVDAQLASLPTYNSVYDAAEHATLAALTDYGVPTKAELDAAAAPLALEATTQATLAALPAEVDAKLSGGHGAGAWGGAGAWPKPFVYTLTNTATGQTIASALIEVYADIGMTALVDQGVTDAYGRVRFELPSGTYYFKRTKTGWDFTNPDTEVQA